MVTKRRNLLEGFHNILRNSHYEVSDVVFDSLRVNSSIFPCVPEVSEISNTNILMKGPGSSLYNFSPPTLPHQKRMRKSASLYHGDSAFTNDAFSSLHAFEGGMSEKIAHSLDYSLPTDHDPANVDPLLFAAVQGNHALINSASKPAPEAMKLKLPSLQYTETGLRSWDTSSSPPTLLDSVDNFIQSPARTGKTDTDYLYQHNSGLLDALVHESKIMSSGKNRSSDKCSAASASSTLTPGDMSSCSSPDMCMTEWEEYGDPIFPFGHSATSAFKECTPMSGNGSSLDKQPQDAFGACKVKPEPLCEAQSREKEQPIPPHCDPTQPDALLASDWIGLGATSNDGQAPIPDTIALLLGDDLRKEYKQSGGVADLAWGLSSCTWKWNNMPACL